MLTAPLKQTPEYKRLLAGMAGAKPAVVALFGMPPTARAQMLAALCEDPQTQTPEPASQRAHRKYP